MRLAVRLIDAVIFPPFSHRGRASWITLIIARSCSPKTTTGVTMTNNVVYNTEGANYHDHEGQNLTVANNIFVMDRNDSTDGAIRSAEPTTNPTWKASFSFHHNIIYSTGPKLWVGCLLACWLHCEMLCGGGMCIGVANGVAACVALCRVELT